MSGGNVYVNVLVVSGASERGVTIPSERGQVICGVELTDRSSVSRSATLESSS